MIVTPPTDIECASIEVVHRYYSEDRMLPLANLVGEAILAERERCAKIALSMTGIFNNAEDIAAAIRSPDKSETP